MTRKWTLLETTRKGSISFLLRIVLTIGVDIITILNSERNRVPVVMRLDVVQVEDDDDVLLLDVLLPSSVADTR